MTSGEVLWGLDEHGYWVEVSGSSDVHEPPDPTLQVACGWVVAGEAIIALDFFF